MVATLVIFQFSSSASNLPTLPLSTFYFHHHLPSSPHRYVSTPPLSHDNFIIHWPQVLIIKASPDTPPHSICTPVRLIPQICGERAVGVGGVKELSVTRSGLFVMSAGSLFLKAGWVLRMSKKKKKIHLWLNCQVRLATRLALNLLVIKQTWWAEKWGRGWSIIGDPKVRKQ